MTLEDILRYSANSSKNTEDPEIRGINVMYDLRFHTSNNTIETPLGFNASTITVPQIEIPVDPEDRYCILPKTALSILNNTIGNTNTRFRNYKISSTDGEEIVFKSAFGIIVTPTNQTILEFTVLRNYATKQTLKYICRINKLFLNTEGRLQDYIKGSLIKNLLTMQIHGYSFDIHICQELKSPIGQVPEPIVNEDEHQQAVDAIYSTNAEDIILSILE